MIPLIVPVYNQLTYLRNILNWWEWYHPTYPIIVMNNGSTYPPLLNYFEYMKSLHHNVVYVDYPENDFIPNLSKTIENYINGKYQYYCISDADIMPHPSIPPNFLDIWKMYIEKGYHRVGFNLIVDQLPKWLNEREAIIWNEKELLNGKEAEEYNGYIGYKAPVDTTFALYTTNNSGWNAPMNGKDWGNCLRIFEAFHLPWHQHNEIVNPEMDYYYKTAKYRVPGEPSAGKNNNRPQKYM